MGCCQSNASRDGAANAQQAIPIEAGVNDLPVAPVPRPAVNARNVGQNRPNQPVRSPSPLARSPKNVSNKPPPWTRSHLEKQRADFFDTRVTGSPEIWTALRRVSEMLRAGDVGNAQAIMDAANVSCPTGRFARPRGKDRAQGGVYDEQGRLYEIPGWVVTDPRDTVEDTEDKIGVDGLDDSEDPANDTDDAARRRELKGKYPATEIGEERRVTIRFSDGNTADYDVVFGSKQPVSVLIQKVLEQRKQNIKLLYLGHELDSKQPLEDQGWQVGTVLQCFIPFTKETSA